MVESLLATLTSERRVLTVTQLTQQIKGLLESEFRDVWVRGEISNFKRHTSGHWYFTLKDAGAQLRCVSFRMQNRLMKFSPEDGLDVYARGRLSVYDQRGEYQLIVEYLEPVGVGSLQLAFEQLKARLAAEGLFDSARKRKLPLLPHKVGIITSRTGAAIHDMLRILKRRNSGVNILICPVQVQGEGASSQIARAIELMNQRDDVDVLIVGRGGGSLEDLWAFNEEVVARAIFASRIPVISAVGHETDFTIADFVADVRAPTPSAAAELVAARRDELVDSVTGLRQRLVNAMHFKLTSLRHRLSQLQARRGFSQATNLLQQRIQRVDELSHRLHIAIVTSLQIWRERHRQASQRMAGLRLREHLAQQRGRVHVYDHQLRHALSRRLEVSRHALHVVMSKLNALSPLAVLDRGYAIVWGPTGTILRQASDVAPGDQLRVKLARGRLTCTTLEVSNDDSSS